jgi:outer membrane protein assembly factor BamA
VTHTAYFRYGSGYGALHELTDVTQRTLQVLVAYNQAEGDRQSKWVGEVSLDLPNIMGTLRHVQVHWRRLSAVTQTFSILYAEPRLPLLPLGARLVFHQDLRDTLYVQRELKLQFTSLPGLRWSTALGIGFRDLRVTRHGSAEGIVPYQHQNINLSLQRQTFDHPANPQSGFRVGLALEGGTLRGEVMHPHATLGRGELHLEGVLSWAKLTLAENIQAMGVTAFRYKPQLADFGRFGGSATIRGYREDQFLAPWGLVSRSELRYRTGRDGRLHLFLDLGQLADGPVLSSGGVGIVFRAGQNHIQLDLAWNQEDTLRSGKVHFRLLNFLSSLGGNQL